MGKGAFGGNRSVFARNHAPSLGGGIHWDRMNSG